MLRIGIDSFITKEVDVGNFALLAHLASVNCNYEYTWDLLVKKYPGQLKKIFSPQHGIMGTEQANMIETSDSIDPRLKVPIISLYKDKRKPSNESLKDIDTVIIDLQDVGARFYTYIYTMSLTMEAAKENNVRVIVLDRPNPIGLKNYYGNINKLKSFVGWHPIAVQHGMTIGELAKFFNEEFNINCQLEVFKVEDLKREYTIFNNLWNWVFPSPNMPTANTAVVYPGGCLLEAVNLSEGRGTTKPFELVGAPFINGYEFSDQLNKEGLNGVIFRPISFRPTFDKYQGENVNGVSIHVTDIGSFNAYLTYLVIIKTAMNKYKDNFSYNPPPYEYEFRELPIDILIGDKDLRLMLERNESVENIDSFCRESVKEFSKIRSKYFMY